MFHGLFSGKFVSLIAALSIVLGAAAPAWAAMPAKAPSDMAMTDMAMPGMSGDCMDMAQHDDTNLPSKNTGSICGICLACGLPISAALLTQGLYRSGEAVFAHDADRSSIAILPALPPPIA